MTPPIEGKARKVEDPDRERYMTEVASLATRLATTGQDDQVVWEVYAETERLIAILKFRLGYETPGVFAKLPPAADMPKLLRDAGELLSKAEGQMRRGMLVESIETLRKARNNLRSYLTERRASATRPERKSKRSAATD